jgi:hypothetical protein
MKRITFCLGITLLLSLILVAPGSTATVTAAPNGPWVTDFGGPLNAVEVRGDYAYAAIGDDLVIFDVSDPTAPTVVSELDLGYPVNDLALLDNYAYVLNKGMSVSDSTHGLFLAEDGFIVVNIANPQVPQVENRLTVIGAGNSQEIEISGERAYVLGQGFDIFDLSDRTHPVRIGKWEHPANGMAVEGTTLYLTVLFGDELKIVDMADPTQPVIAGSYETAVEDRIAVQGNYVHVAASLAGGELGVEIFDVSDPSLPQKISDYQPYPTGCRAEAITEIALDGTHAFVTMERCGLAVVEISNPSAPQVLAHEEIRGGARSLSIAGDYVYVGGSGGGLQVVDVSTPASPTVSGAFRRVGVFSSMALHNSLLYVPTTHGLHRIDVSDPHRPAQTAYLDQEGHEIALSGNYGYLTRRSSSDSEPSELQILNLSTLQTVGALDIPGYTDDHVVVGEYAYVGTILPPTYDLQLRVVDVSNPVAPQARGTYDVGEPEPYSLYLAAEDDVLYVSAGGDLHLFDISNPMALQSLTAPEIPAPRQIAIKNGYAYVRTGSLSVSNGLYILDVSTPTSPTVVGSYAEDDLWTSASSMDVSARYAYVSTYRSGLFVFDIREPTQPLPLGRIQDRRSQRINDVLVDGEYIYAADTAQGLRVLREVGFGTITGRLLKASGEGMYGDLRIDGAVDVAADASGTYTVTVPAGCHTVAPWTWYYIWDPPRRRACVTADSTVEEVDFIARNILKSVVPTGPADYGDVLTYTLQLASGFMTTDALVMDEVPTYTTYISNSLRGPAGLVYDPALDAITGTLSLGALDPVTVSFAVRVEVTGTQQSAPIITNRAYLEADTSAILPQWSNEVRTLTYVHRAYLPLTLRE